MSWKLRDASGRPLILKRVSLLIICPTGDSSSIAFASGSADGSYHVVAAVPPGGIGTLSIGANHKTFRITNPYRR